MPLKKYPKKYAQSGFKPPILPTLLIMLLAGVVFGPEFTLLPLLRLLGIGALHNAAAMHHETPILIETEEGRDITPVQLQKHLIFKETIHTTLNEWNQGPFRLFVQESFPKIIISLRTTAPHHFEDTIIVRPNAEGVVFFPDNMPSSIHLPYLIRTEMLHVLGRMLRKKMPHFKDEAKQLAQCFSEEIFNAISNSQINKSTELLTPIGPIFPIITATKNLSVDSDIYPYGEIEHPLPLLRSEALNLQPLFAYMPQKNIQTFLCDTTFNSPEIVTLWVLLTKSHSEAADKILISLCSLPEPVFDAILPKTKVQFSGFIKRAEKSLSTSAGSGNILYNYPLQSLFVVALCIVSRLLVMGFFKEDPTAITTPKEEKTEKIKKEKNYFYKARPYAVPLAFATPPVIAAPPLASSKSQEAPPPLKIQATQLLKELRALLPIYINNSLPSRLDDIAEMIKQQKYSAAIHVLTGLKQNYFSPSLKVSALISLLTEFRHAKAHEKIHIAEKIDNSFCKLSERERTQFQFLTEINFEALQENAENHSSDLTQAFLDPLIRNLERATQRPTFTRLEGAFSGAKSYAVETATHQPDI